MAAPLVQPFRTALGAHERMENLLFTVTLRDGTAGQGEAAIATHITGETIQETRRHLEILGQELTGNEISDYCRLSAVLHERLPHNKSVIAAVEGAVLDALTRQREIPLWKLFGPKAVNLRSDITIVLADLKETETAVKKYFKKGFRAFKVKVGRDRDLDIKRVMSVQRLAPRSVIYIDANQAFGADEALGFLQELKRAGIEPALLEQPVPREDLEGLKKVSRSTSVPVCADESVRSLKDAIAVIKGKIAPVINIKLMKTGIVESRAIAYQARANNVKLMIGGMMESSLAMTTAAHLAAGLGCFDYVDLDTPFFIKSGWDRNPYLSASGVYTVSRVKQGVGITTGDKMLCP